MFFNEFPDFQCVKHIIAPLGFLTPHLFCPSIPLLGKPSQCCLEEGNFKHVPQVAQRAVKELEADVHIIFNYS